MAKKIQAFGVTITWGTDGWGGNIDFGTDRDDDKPFAGKGYDPKNVMYGSKNDKVFGSRVDDVIFGGQGKDKIRGGDGNDKLIGGYALFSPDDGSDTIFGDAGHDQIWGNGGNDFLSGGTGNDTLHGGLGNDRLAGDFGADRMTGSDGSDTFIFDYISDSPVTQPGNVGAIDVITDFNRREHDKIDLSHIDARHHHKNNDAFFFIGGDYQGRIGLKPGEVGAYHVGNDTYIQAWDGNKSGPSLLIKLEGFTGSITASDLYL